MTSPQPPTKAFSETTAMKPTLPCLLLPTTVASTSTFSGSDTGAQRAARPPPRLTGSRTLVPNQVSFHVAQVLFAQIRRHWCWRVGTPPDTSVKWFCWLSSRRRSSPCQNTRFPWLLLCQRFDNPRIVQGTHLYSQCARSLSLLFSEARAVVQGTSKKR